MVIDYRTEFSLYIIKNMAGDSNFNADTQCSPYIENGKPVGSKIFDMIFNNSVSSLTVWYDEGSLRIERSVKWIITDASMEVNFYVNGELAKQYSIINRHGNGLEFWLPLITTNLYPSTVPVDSHRIPEGSDFMRIESRDAAGAVLYEGRCWGISNGRPYGDFAGDVKSFWEEIKCTIPEFEERWQALRKEKEAQYRELIRGNKQESETEENTKKTNSLRQWIKRLFRKFN